VFQTHRRDGTGTDKRRDARTLPRIIHTQGRPIENRKPSLFYTNSSSEIASIRTSAKCMGLSELQLR